MLLTETRGNNPECDVLWYVTFTRFRFYLYSISR